MFSGTAQVRQTVIDVLPEPNSPYPAATTGGLGSLAALARWRLGAGPPDANNPLGILT